MAVALSVPQQGGMMEAEAGLGQAGVKSQSGHPCFDNFKGATCTVGCFRLGKKDLEMATTSYSQSV